MRFLQKIRLLIDKEFFEEWETSIAVARILEAKEHPTCQKHMNDIIADRHKLKADKLAWDRKRWRDTRSYYTDMVRHFNKLKKVYELKKIKYNKLYSEYQKVCAKLEKLGASK